MKKEYESYKIKKEILKKVRKIKEKKGINMTFFIEQAILEKLENEKNNM